ncbi:hypothetical protein AMECASPLE_018030 [Ameca splendens]|uniref:Uncharacterized protein n=1 Tax=Ameca splendens TaxID=208324 RepID=A0ABV0XFN6_9TELE
MAGRSRRRTRASSAVMRMLLRSVVVKRELRNGVSTCFLDMCLGLEVEEMFADVSGFKPWVDSVLQSCELGWVQKSHSGSVQHAVTGLFHVWFCTAEAGF